MKYHVFDEREHFSEFSGGAISRWAANVLREDDDTHIVCVAADDSWGFPSERIRPAPGFSRYLKFRARRYYPSWLNGLLIRGLYGGQFPQLQAGDVVWVHGQPAIAHALSYWTKRARAKLVLHMHGSQFATNPAGALWKAAQAVDQVVFCSKYLKEEAEARFPKMQRTTVLYNGADDSLFYPAPADQRTERPVPVVLVACRLVPEKGVHVLMDAMRLLQQKGVPVEARVLGSSFFGGSPPSPYVKKLHSIAPSNVNFAGYYAGKELAEQFRQADMFCLPATYNDPFPLAIIEAMASELPLVTTRRGGIPEALAEGGGLLVAPSSPEELAQAIETLAPDADLRHKIAHEGYLSFKKNFTWGSVRDRYREIVNSL